MGEGRGARGCSGGRSALLACCSTGRRCSSWMNESGNVSTRDTAGRPDGGAGSSAGSVARSGVEARSFLSKDLPKRVRASSYHARNRVSRAL